MKQGVYLNLPDEEYFGADALGSTDLAKLCKSPSDWWWNSRYNPDLEVTNKEGLAFGQALHALILEGEEAFERAISISPFDSFVTKLAREWRDEQLENGKYILNEKEKGAAYHMAALVLNHPQLGGIKSGLTEVAVFWERDGVKFRAKFDSLLPSYSIDLKSYTGNNTQGRNPKDNALRIIANNNYDVQRALYEEAREQLIIFVRDGLIFGGSEEQLNKLSIVATREEWAWLWVFYQKIDNKTGKAPIIMPLASRRADNAHQSGFEKIKAALANYNAYLGMFGKETPWAQINPITEIQDHEYMPWMMDVAIPEFEDEAA